jgi:hypothetical protein
MGIIHLPRACRNNASAHGPVGSVARVHFVATAIHPHASRCAHVTSTAAPSAHPHKDHAPFAMSSSHRASGTRAGSAAHGSRGRPSWRCQYRARCAKPWEGSRGPRDEERHATAIGAAGRTYPAIVKSGDVSGVVCGCNGWFGACVGRRGCRMMREEVERQDA